MVSLLKALSKTIGKTPVEIAALEIKSVALRITFKEMEPAGKTIFCRRRQPRNDIRSIIFRLGLFFVDDKPDGIAESGC